MAGNKDLNLKQYKARHLTKQYSKPEEGEYVPITFIEFERKTVGWSPELKRSVYIEKGEGLKLKRVREVNVMIAINHLSGKLTFIELNDEQRKQFEKLYDQYLERGGLILYTRKKIGGRAIPFFELWEKNVKDRVEKSLMSDRI